MKRVFRPATKADIQELCGEAKWTFRAYACEIDDKLMGVGGIYYQGGEVVVFSLHKPEMKKYPVTMARATKFIMDMIKDRSCFAVADLNINTAPELLERLGFQHVSGRTYKWHPTSAH